MIFLLCLNHHHASEWAKEQGMSKGEFYNQVVVCATQDPSSFVRLRGRKFYKDRDKIVRLDDRYQGGKYFCEVYDGLVHIGVPVA